MTVNKQEDWFTAIVIKDLKESDFAGNYTFTAKTGPAVTTEVCSFCPNKLSFTKTTELARDFWFDTTMVK